MNTSDLPSKSLSTWKRLAIISLFGAAGFAITAGLILGGVVWYTSRPALPKPWNTTVIIAKDPPGFSVSNDGKTIEFTYVLENRASSDYRIDSLSEIQMFGRGRDGTLSHPIPDTDEHFQLPVFIPARQKAVLSFSLITSEIPTRDVAESDATFHERIRKFLEQHLGNLSGFVIFDSTDRYEIDLPKWLAEAPKEQKP